jgi:hypothetical protein
MTYDRFNELIKNCQNQFLIHALNGDILFLRIGNAFYNPIGVVATNEKTFELEIVEYDKIKYVIVDGCSYK